MRKTAAVLIATAAWAGAGGEARARQATPTVPPVEIRLEVNPLVECHFLLKNYAGEQGKSAKPAENDVKQEASFYSQAREHIQTDAAWRWLEDRVVAGPDPAAIREAARSLPANIDTPESRLGIGMTVDALEAAYPKYLAAFWPERQRALNQTLVAARKLYHPVRARIAETLMQKMDFSGLDAPITVFGVVRAGRLGTWGKAGAGYYTVVGMYGASPLAFLEAAIHEATHVLDAMQSYSGTWILKRVRDQIIQDGPPEAVDTFLHGLVAYNAGELVRRFVSSGYDPVGLRAPTMEEAYAPYVSTYRVVWNGHLEGKTTAEAVAAKLAEEFRAVQKLKAARKKT